MESIVLDQVLDLFPNQSALKLSIESKSFSGVEVEGLQGSWRQMLDTVS